MNTPSSPGDSSSATFRHQRVLPHPPARVYEAFARPEVVARWWGPLGFTNTIESFDFKPGGHWKFVMHAPNGSNHPNENVFLKLEAPSLIVMHHVSEPRYKLTVTLTAEAGGTAITWVQEFEDQVMGSRLAHIVKPANEQNLDRLQSVLAGR